MEIAATKRELLPLEPYLKGIGFINDFLVLQRVI
jgi:hypothetical protein